MAYRHPEPEFTPRFPYNHLPYTHIHPSEEGSRKHVTFRAHDCWCEPIPVFVLGNDRVPVAILLIHSDDHVPKYPHYKAVKDDI